MRWRSRVCTNKQDPLGPWRHFGSPHKTCLPYMSKILVLALFLCIALAAAQPWTPHVPMAWDSDVVAALSIAPEIEVIGTPS
jgi:hypothetical protein